MLFGRLLPFAPRAGDNAWLDLLRALAIVLVLMRHGYMADTPPGAVTGFFGFVALNGWIGVDLFFVLSGYLISRHLIRSGLGTSAFSWRRYLAMRALRIVPAYVAVLALILLAAFPHYRIAPDDLAFRTAYHLLFLQDYLPADINVVFWSLGVEEKFYLFAPLLLWIVLARKAPGYIALLLAVLFLLPLALRGAIYIAHAAPMNYVTFFRWLRSPFHASLDPLIVGVAISVIERVCVTRLSPGAAKGTLIVSAAALVTWMGSRDFMAEISFFEATTQPALVAVLCGGMVFGAAHLKSLPFLLDPVTRPIARLSYSLYLVHFPLLPFARTLAGTIGGAGVAFWLTYLSLCLLTAGVLYAAIERPFLRLKDELARRPDAQPLPRPVPASRL